MDTSIVLAKVMGPLFLILSISILLNKRYYQEVYEEFLDNPALVYLGGLLGIIMGSLILLLHNIWIKEWPVIITVIGWLIFVKSLLLLFLPETFGNFARRLSTSSKLLTFIGIVWLIIGLYLILMGFENAKIILNL